MISGPAGRGLLVLILSALLLGTGSSLAATSRLLAVCRRRLCFAEGHQSRAAGALGQRSRIGDFQ